MSRHDQIERLDPVVGGLSFEPVKDAEPFTDNEPSALFGRALVTWLVCTVVGGLVLTGVIALVSEYFGAPAFAELGDYMGFVMGAVLGLPIAGALLFNALRDGQ